MISLIIIHIHACADQSTSFFLTCEPPFEAGNTCTGYQISDIDGGRYMLLGAGIIRDSTAIIDAVSNWEAGNI